MDCVMDETLINSIRVAKLTNYELNFCQFNKPKSVSLKYEINT